MNSIKYFYSSITVIIIFIAIIVFAINGSNRLFNDTVNLPTESQKNSAFFVFIISMLVGYFMPIILLFKIKKFSVNAGWPLHEFILLFIGVLFAISTIFISDLPIPYQDIVGIFVLYIISLITYTFSLKKAIENVKIKSWNKVIATLILTLFSIIIFFIINWMIVYFE